MLLNLPDNQRRFAEKREFPRVDVNETGLIRGIASGPGDIMRLPEEEIELRIHNISVSGVGFTLEKDAINGESNWSQIDLELHIGFFLSCRAELVRQDLLGDRYYYGVQFTDMSSEQVNSLRAFVLRKQIESYFENKKIETEKRMFK